MSSIDLVRNVVEEYAQKLMKNVYLNKNLKRRLVLSVWGYIYTHTHSFYMKVSKVYTKVILSKC